MGSKGSQQTTQTYTPNSAVGASGTTALTMAQNAANLPFQQQVAPVAGMNDDWASAFAQMRGAATTARPYMGAAANMFTQSANPISAGQVGNYLNPFANFIMGGLQDVFGQQRRDATGRLTQAAGGVGADRIGVAQANLAKQQGLAAGQTLAGIYQPALAAAQQDAQRQQSAGFGLGQLGSAAQTAEMAGAQGLGSIGQVQRQYEQERLNAPYLWDQARIAHQYQIPQWLSGITAQTAPALGGTTTNTYPGQSPWGTIAGLGMTALGAATGNPMMMGSGLKGTMSGLGSGAMGGASQGPMGFGGYQPGMSGPMGGTWMPAPHGPGSMGLMFSDGGFVDLEDIGGSYQEGGDVDLESTYWPPMPTTNGNPAGIDWNAQTPEVAPDVTNALQTGAPLPGRVALPPPAPPTVPQGQPALPISMRPDLPPEITGGQDGGMPPTALGFAPQTPFGPMPRMPAPAAPPAPSQQSSPYDLPPDPNEGAWSRGPGAALMAAGLATMAAAGKRDSRGLPTPPFAAIGEGGLRGIETLKAQDTAATQRRRVDLEARRLLQQAEHQRNTLAETKRYHDMIDADRRQRSAETTRYHDILDRSRRDALDARMDPSRLTPQQQALIAATRRKQQETGDQNATLDDNEILDIIQRTQRQPTERNLSPEQQVIEAERKRLGRDPTAEEITEALTKLRQGSRNPPRPLTPEQQAIQARERELGRPLNETEIAQVVQTVRQGPPPPPGEAPASTILGTDEVAPNFEGATGLGGLGTDIYNKVTGAFGAQAYPAEHKATRILNDLSVKTQSTLQNVAGRPSNYWLGRLESLTVKPNSWKEGPQAARDRLTQTRDTIDQEIKRVDALIANPQTSKSDRSKAIRSVGELRGLKADYDAVIGAWGGGAGNPLAPIGEGLAGAAPSTGQVRETATGAAGNIPQGVREPPRPPRPANAPPGSRLQRSNTGRYRWVGPDGRPLEP